MSAAAALRTAAPMEANGSLADFIWFRCGGPAEWLARPRDEAELAELLGRFAPGVPVMAVGVGSNLLVRDGGVAGLVVRLPKSFAKVTVGADQTLTVGAAAMGISVASAARDAGVAGLEFLRGIPGTMGGAVAMNAGAYGREVADILKSVRLMLRDGTVAEWPAARLRFGYRHASLPPEAIILSATVRGWPGDPVAIAAEMDRIAAEREESQPLRSRTGGSTFRNPPGEKAWALIDRAGCRGLTLGGAQVSVKHCNFLLNTGTASGDQLERLGEHVRERVLSDSGVDLQWEIKRVGLPA